MRAAPSGLSCRLGCAEVPRPFFPPLLSTHWTLSFYGDPQHTFLQTGTTCQYGQRARRRGRRRGELPTSSTTPLPILNGVGYSAGPSMLGTPMYAGWGAWACRSVLALHGLGVSLRPQWRSAVLDAVSGCVYRVQALARAR